MKNEIRRIRAKSVSFGPHSRAGDIIHQAPAASVALESAEEGVRVGFAIDVVGYSARSAGAKVDVQRRLTELVQALEQALDRPIRADSRQSSGDGVIAFLATDVSPHRALTVLIRTTADRLATDNARFRDRVRLRMGLAVGSAPPAPNGFGGDTVIECSRLVDSDPVRARLTDHPDEDLAVIVSSALYQFTVAERPSAPGLGTFTPVQVTVKDFAAPAWLWDGDPVRAVRE